MLQRVQFGMRTCLVVLAVAAVALGIHSNVRYSADRQRDIVGRINQAGIDAGLNHEFDGEVYEYNGVTYDYGRSIVGAGSESHFDTKSEGTDYGPLNVPKLLLDQFGVDYFCQVKTVEIPGADWWNQRRPTAEFERWRAEVGSIVRDIHQLHGLEELSLATTGMDADALDGLRDLGSLRKLVIRDTTTVAHLERIVDSSITIVALHGSVSDEQLTAIGRAAQLVEIDMGFLSKQDSNFTGSGIEAISALPNLRSLSICSHNLSTEGMEHLSNVNGLAELRLRAPGVTGLHRVISKMPLRSLYVFDMKLNDHDLKAIARLDSLRELCIYNSTSTTLPSLGLEELVRSPSLRRIELNGIALTVAEVRHLAECANSLELLVVSSQLISYSDPMDLTTVSHPSFTIKCMPAQ